MSQTLSAKVKCGHANALTFERRKTAENHPVNLNPLFYICSRNKPETVFGL